MVGDAARLGVWIEFTDVLGKGYAQPDAFIVTPHATFAFEAKLTQTRGGELQLTQLYAPLLRKIYMKPVVGVLVCKNLRWKPQLEIEDLSEILRETEERVWTWHWL